METHNRKSGFIRNLTTYALLGLAILPSSDYGCNRVTPNSGSKTNLEARADSQNSGSKPQNQNVLANYQPSLEKFLENTKPYWKNSEKQRAVYEQYFNSLDTNEQRIVGAFTSDKDFKEYQASMSKSEKQAVEDYARTLTAKDLAEYHSKCPLIPKVKSPKYLTKQQKCIIYGLKVNEDMQNN